MSLEYALKGCSVAGNTFAVAAIVLDGTMRSLVFRPHLHRLRSGGWVACALGLWLGATGGARAEPARERVARLRPPPSFSASDDRMPALESLGDGRLRHHGAGFVATVHPDGSVDFRDTAATPVLKLLGVDVLRFGSRRPPRDQRDPGFPKFLDETGLSFYDARALMSSRVSPQVQARFGGLADWKLGERNAARKFAFLEATAALRLRMNYAWTRARLEKQLAGFGDRLQEIWGDRRVPLAERKRRLFALWDECDDPGGAEVGSFDALRSAAAQGARAKLSAYVRIVAPEGSAQAFTAEELARLNAGRLSRARFDPYRDLAPAPPLPDLVLPPAPPRAAEEAPVEVLGPTPGPVVTPVERTDPPDPKTSKRRTRAWPRPVQVKWIGPIPVLHRR